VKPSLENELETLAASIVVPADVDLFSFLSGVLTLKRCLLDAQTLVTPHNLDHDGWCDSHESWRCFPKGCPTNHTTESEQTDREPDSKE
jgi:hypothetical protein